MRAPIASSPQMLGSIGAAFKADVLADVEIGYDPALEAGYQAQPPHAPLVVDTPYGYPEDSGTVGTPEIADIYRDFDVDVVPLALASTSVSAVLTLLPVQTCRLSRLSLSILAPIMLIPPRAAVQSWLQHLHLGNGSISKNFVGHIFRQT